MEFINVKNSLAHQNSKVIKKVPILTDQLMSTLLYIDSDTETPAHSHTNFDEIHYIIQGNGEITIGEEHRSISAGMLILVPKTKPHYYSTVKDKLLVLTTGLVKGCFEERMKYNIK